MQLLANLKSSFENIVDSTPVTQLPENQRYNQVQQAHKDNIDQLEATLTEVNDSVVEQLHSAVDAKEKFAADLANVGDPNPISATNFATWTAVATKLTELVKKLNPAAQFTEQGRLQTA